MYILQESPNLLQCFGCLESIGIIAINTMKIMLQYFPMTKLLFIV